MLWLSSYYCVTMSFVCIVVFCLTSFVCTVNEIVALVESKETARNAVPPTEATSVSTVQRLHDADHRARRNATPCRESHNLPDRSKQSRCPLYQRLFQLYKKGACGWNTKPYTLCIECYRTQKRRRRHFS